MISFRDWDNDGKMTPLTLEEVKDILSRSKKISIFNKDPFPEGRVTFVGLSNEKYECKTLWDIEYTNHREHSYGGYFNEEHTGWTPWWTMNCNYNNRYDKDIVYIVENESDGEKLAAFLNFTYGVSNIYITLIDKRVELNKIKAEVEYLEKAYKMFNEEN